MSDTTEKWERQRVVLKQAMVEVYEDLKDETFYDVPEGRGGTFAFGRKSDKLGKVTHCIENVTHIGTFWCITCVGLYIQVDKNRCLMAHIHSWTLNGDKLFRMDAAGGEEIQKQVWLRLWSEYERCGWDCRDENFGQLVAMCSLKAVPGSREQAKSYPQLSSMIHLGWFVFLGVEKFLKDQVTALFDEAEQACVRAKDLSGLSEQHSVDSAPLLDHIKDLRTKADMSDRNRLADLEAAVASTETCIELERKAGILSETVTNMEMRAAHGFVVNQGSDKAALARWIYMDPGANDFRKCREYKWPSDLGNFVPMTAERHETEHWHFCLQNDADKWWAPDQESPSSYGFCVPSIRESAVKGQVSEQGAMGPETVKDS